MNRISALTTALQAERNQTTLYADALHQLQRMTTPSIYSQHIKEITELHRSKPAQLDDGKDWARRVMHEQHKFHPMAVKWAREVLNRGAE